MELFLIRGLPGSGKSTFAAKLGVPVVEADDFRIKDGKYHFDPKDNALCHAECLRRTKRLLEDGQSVAVSNTFVKRWEMQPYYDLGVPVTELMMLGSFENIHNVPKDVVGRMRNDWEF